VNEGREEGDGGLYRRPLETRASSGFPLPASTFAPHLGHRVFFWLISAPQL